MGEPKISSKRQALRFAGDDHPILFKTEFEDGEGLIANISARGCAIRAATLPLAFQEKILIALKMKDDEIIEIGARVIRVEGETVAVQFIHLEEEDKLRIVKFFAGKQRSA
jgi:hypothetical protein